MDLQEFIENVRRIDSHEIERLLSRSEDNEDRDIRPLRVMISSPRHGLEAEREALDQAISRLSDISLHLFEKLDSGHTNIEESLRLVRKCDFLIALFDPGYHGTPIGNGKYRGQYYSEIEFKEACERKAKPPSDWPLIFVYVKGNAALTGWHHDCVERCNYAPTARFTSTQELVEKVQSLLIGHNIEIRSARVKQLAKQAQAQEQELGLICTREKFHVERIGLQDQQLAEQRKILHQQQKQHEQFSTTLSEGFSSDLERLRNAAEESRKADLLEIDTLRRKVNEGRNSALKAVLVGAAVAALPAVMLGQTMFRNHTSSIVESVGKLGLAAQTTLTSAADSLSAAMGRSPLFVQNTEFDAMLLAQKIQLAKDLNMDFDCSKRDIRSYPVQNTAGFSLNLLRDSACASEGPLMLVASTPGMPACGFQPIIDGAWWKKFSTQFNSSVFRIRLVRLIGHASSDQILNSCGRIPPDMSSAVLKTFSGRDFADGQISTNVGLAYVRAWQQAQALGAKETPELFEIDSLGMLDSQQHPDSKDRRVTLAIYIARSR